MCPLLHGCTLWSSLAWGCTTVVILHQWWCFVPLWYRLVYRECILSRVISIGRLCWKSSLKHLWWNFCDLYRLWLTAPTACPWSPLVSPLYLGCIGKFPTEECKRHVILSYMCSQLHCGCICVKLKGLWEVRMCQDSLFNNCCFYVFKCILVNWIPLPRTFLGLIFLVVFISLHSTT